MREPKEQADGRNLQQRGQGPAVPGHKNDVSTKTTSEGDGGLDASRSQVAVGKHRPSDDYANSVYSKQARDFSKKFRAFIGHGLKARLLQVFLGMAFLGALVLVSWRSREDMLFDTPFEELSTQRQQELRFRWLQVLACLAMAITGYCFLENRDGLLVRPHPGFWRLVHGLNFTYFLILVFLVTLHRSDGRILLRVLVPGLRPLEKNVFSGTLVLDCSMGMKTLMRQLKSLWFTSHVIGWFVKMCIFRSWMFNLTFSIFFEFCELSLQWLIPEFQECWWDSIFIDAIVSNLMGMIFGCAVMRWCGKPHFDWLGAYPMNQNVLLKFMPFSSCEYEFSFFRTPRHLLLTGVLLFFSLLAEVNVFLLMNVLDIPAVHWLNPFRLVLLGLLSFAAVAEFYAHLHFKSDRMGGSVFLFVMILIVEVLLSIKYGVDRFFAASPDMDVVVPWVLAGVLFGVWCRCYFAKASAEQAKEASAKEADAKEETGKAQRTTLQERACEMLLKLPPQACFLPLLYLAKQYYYGS
uniref:Phosphatidylthreonine synthase n=1 Tax=Eimeria falciformis TaxID=84963 RepID=A0A221S609_9EIME|nr:phosphatidylthreonine synthase [Eimeria falciformis]